ncbi:MAG: glycosyl transferase family 36 [Hyphomicrobiales bacterium]|nr:glycosyl transferase family 36 [Hyphomicrobiales bacterium]
MNWAANAPDRHIPHFLSVLAGVALVFLAIGAAGMSGVAAAALAGVAAGFSLAALSPQRRSAAASGSIALFDGFVVFVYGFLCNPSSVLWQAPPDWRSLFAFTPVGASCAAGLYLVSILIIMAYSGARPSRSASISLALIPFLFCIVIGLGSNLPADLGRIIVLGAPVDYFWIAAIGRVFFLFLFNEAIIAGASIALGRRPQTDLKLHAMLFGAAAYAAFTPIIASYGSLEFAQSLPPALGVVYTAVMAALAQAGLWGETYLVTQTIADLLHGSPPIEPAIRKPWRSGAGKGAVYGFLFMGLVGAVGAVTQNATLWDAFAASGAVGAAILGALFYPLGRTIMESTDSTPPFSRRLAREYRRPLNFIRGIVIGAAVWYAAEANVAAWSGGNRFLFGLITGAAAYAGVDLAADIVPLLTGRRRHLSSWRIYLFGAVLGGVVGGALGWYFDTLQLETVQDKFYAYTAIFYPHWGKQIVDYGVTPLFQKWGHTSLGPVQGAVKLFYLESLSGVIQWIFAAPLFSINLFFLTAAVKRDLKPLRALFSEEGVRALVDNAILVLRWGLWMAPIIYTFLKAVPDPAWYNQDGLVRTGVATLVQLTQPHQDFVAWSLSIFTALLAYDWLRVLIWFDHMGLRVATLVNLSFVGGDALDEWSARFLGKAQVSRAIPEGLRRFGTWAPLLLPFYIPKGADWDKAWTGAEKLHGATQPTVSLLLGYMIVATIVAIVLASLVLRRLSAANRRSATEGTGIAGLFGAKPYMLTNGYMSSYWYDDGQGVSVIERAARGGPQIDITRTPDDPAQPRGKFIYFREGDGELWSLGNAPCPGGDETRLQRLSPTQLFLSRARNGIRVEATIEVVEGECVEVTRVKLVNLERRARRLTVASLREWVMNETGVERRDAAYNAIHVGTWFLREPAAIIAQNRLLKTERAKQSQRRMSHEVGFHAAGAGETGDIRLVGYEDMKSRFFGLGTSADPATLTGAAGMRSVDDEGLLFSFEPCASLCFEARIAPESTTEIVFVDGWAANFDAAIATIARHLDQAAPDAAAVARIAERQRSLLPAPAKADAGFAFAPDGRALEVRPGTSRPLAHVIANSFGQGAVLTNDGDIFSFSVNARQNSLTPFRMGEGRAGPAAQAIYVRDMSSGDTDCATFLPLRRMDGAYDATFGLGYVVYRRKRDDLDFEMTVFTPPGRTCEVKLLRIANKTGGDRMFTVAPIAEMVLDETPIESQNAIQSQVDANGRAVYFRNPKNVFVKGWAFAATSMAAEFAETARRRAFGPRIKPTRLPYMVEHGHPEIGSDRRQRSVAAFAGPVEVKANSETTISFVLGQTGTLEDARHFAEAASDVEWGVRALDETKSFWDTTLGVLRIETNQPEFDRLVNDWLPYQLLASRLWGRTGPAQRSGATGYRDQLQDVLPLVFLAPELSRRQILLHAGRQFIEGDAVKWWHTAPGGGTGLADRTIASDPHLWLPFVTLRYVEATGDEAVLDTEVPFIDGDPVPHGQEGAANVPLPSREQAKLFDHCRIAIEWTLERMGRNGLPLMGSGDWDDGMNLIGFEGRGESVWVGFFLHGILVDFAKLCDRRGRRKFAARYRAEAEKLRAALDKCWRGDRYLRAYADNGHEVTHMSAMVSSWPVLSGAVDFSRGVEVVENALALLARPDRVLLVTPHYDEQSDPFPGRSAEYPPGVRENGGQYSHGSSWFVDALVKLAETAAAKGDRSEAERLYARAFEIWKAISPLSKYATPEAADMYGLPPHQQPADVYQGPGYEGRGGWAWYTGSAARMMIGAYALLGLRLDKGEFSLRDDAFTPKGGLQLRKVVYKGRTFEAPAMAEATAK